MRVAKHGNRSISSKCGSADVMEALGVNIQLSPERCGAMSAQVGIAFFLRPPASGDEARAGRPPRTAHAHRLQSARPADQSRARLRAGGGRVFADLVEKLAEALSMLGLHRALVVHGIDGLDEITITGPTRVAEVREGTSELRSRAGRVRHTRATLEEISGGDATANAAIIRAS